MDKQISGKTTILLKKLIKPSSQTPDHLSIHNLSAIDQFSPTRHIPVLYFYSASENVDAKTLATRFEQLEKSLSESLSCYYPLAGRFAAEALSVDCQDQGVLYMIAKVGCQLNQFLDEANKYIDLLESLVPRSTVEDHDPLARVQISTFECGGMALAVETHHTISDGSTAFTFVNLWAKINRFGITHAKLPSFDSSAIWPPFKGSEKFKNNLGERLVAKRLLLDGAAIGRLKEEVKARAPDMDGQPSRVEIVTGFMWRGLIRASQARHQYLRPSMTTLSVNLRGRSPAGIPENAFGNIYIPVPIKFMEDESKLELHFLVRLIRDAVRKTVSECDKASKDELCSMTLKANEEIIEWFGKDEVDVRGATSWCRFPLYEPDFGWGKASRVSPLKMLIPMFVMMDTKCGTGVEVTVTLHEMEMQKLESDPNMAPFFSPKLD